jgi:hypothetical protein
MHVHSLRKLLILTIAYAAIIVGIFVLQFRNESLISRDCGLLHIALAETSDKDQNKMLKNTFRASFRGVSFFATDDTPLTITGNDIHNGKHLTLLSWSQTTPLSFEFVFTENVLLTFSISNETPDADLFITATLPPGVTSVSLPYKPTGGFTVTDRKNKKAVFDSRNKTYQLAASQISEDRLSLTNSESRAFYTAYNKQETFSLDTVSDFAAASRSIFDETVGKYRDAVVANFNAADTSLDEKSTVAYVAEMASRGSYDRALDTVPDSFKKGTKRTYLSAPYFGSLKDMEQTLEMQREQYKTMIDYSLSSNSCDIFTIYSIPDYLLQNTTDQTIQKLMAMPASIQDFSPSVLQAGGILHIYSRLNTAAPALAAGLEPILEKCIQSILSSITIQDDSILISNNGMNISILQAVQIGETLTEYGSLTQNQQITDCGYLIVNSYLTKISSQEERTLGELYPVIVSGNTYYPHYISLADGVWAWTCAQNITYTTDKSRTVTLDIEFPQGLTQYLIISGIQDFVSIEIYGLNFHTDPRFETYNSSGYVHIAESNMLLLKSRHKNNHEIIRIFYSIPPSENDTQTEEE